MSLDKIGIECNTDKSSKGSLHPIRGYEGFHNYLRVYEAYIRDLVQLCKKKAIGLNY